MSNHRVLKSILTVPGLALLVVGLSLFIANPTISRRQALQRVVTFTTEPDGRTRYSGTKADIEEALEQRRVINTSRIVKLQLGAALSMLGTVLLSLRLVMALAERRNKEDQAGLDPINASIHRTKVASRVCPECGEEIEEQFDACWHCGNTKDVSPLAGTQ